MRYHRTMVILGVILLACTITILAAEFLRRRAHPLPAYGWVGLVCLLIAEALMFHGIEPVATFFTPIAWTAYALIADAAVFAIRGHSRLRDAPGRFARLALLSIPLWLIFEAYNLRLANWTYAGGWQLSLPVRWFAYGWAFATIWPGIFLTADLVESFGWWDRPSRPIFFSRTVQNVFMTAGVVLLMVPVLLPARLGSYLFGAVWAGFILLLDPINFRLGLPSLEGDLASGRRGRFPFLSHFRLGVWLALGVLELLGCRQMALYFPDHAREQDLRDACGGLCRFSALCGGMFCDVLLRSLASRMGKAIASPNDFPKGRDASPGRPADVPALCDFSVDLARRLALPAARTCLFPQFAGGSASRA